MVWCACQQLDACGSCTVDSSTILQQRRPQMLGSKACGRERQSFTCATCDRGADGAMPNLLALLHNEGVGDAALKYGKQHS